MESYQKQSCISVEIQDNWFIPDETLSVGNDIYILSELDDSDNWHIRCADAWEKNILERDKMALNDILLKDFESEELNSEQLHPHQPQQPPPFSISPYVVTTNDKHNVIEILDINSDVEGYFPLLKNEILDTIPTFFRDVKMILIPKKAKRILQRTNRKRLKEIDNNINVAIEKCLLVLSNLSDTYYLKMYYTKEKRWKPLSSRILNGQTRKGHKSIYPKILALLKDLNLIEIRRNKDGVETYQPGVSSKQYRFTENIYDTGYTQYIISSSEIIQCRLDIEKELIKKNKKNIIVQNILEVRKRTLIPTLKFVKKEGIKLTKGDGGYVKKGKRLVYLNKRAKNNYDKEKHMFLEDHIKLYETLYNALAYPKCGTINSGKRVADFFNLIPSWIRKLIKIDGEKTVEIDIVTSHPNIVMSIYGGSGARVSHDIVSEYLGIERGSAKKEHLSFFNKHPNRMKKSKLYKYYMLNEPDMMENLIEEKREFGYKITSKHLMTKETEVITKAIQFLNKKGIYVGYIYDGLQSKESDRFIVKEAMDKSLKLYNINTTASIKLNNKINTIASVT